ncbi:MAG: porin [Pseudomonadota bacterium]|nr:porin [Pseudomonadota bacterium]
MFKKSLILVLITLCNLTYSGSKADEVKNINKEIIQLKEQISNLEKKIDKNELSVKWEPAPSFSRADKMFEMNIRGRIFSDAAWISDKDDNISIKATELRAARLGIEGKAWNSIKYKFEADFADDQTTVKDAMIEWKTKSGIKWLTGQFKTPNSLDEQTSSRHTSLMERASFTDAFGLARRIGLGVSLGGDRWTGKIGMYKGANNIEAENEGHEIAGRFTFSPRTDEIQLHLGGSLRFRSNGSLSEYRYRQRPHQHLSSRFVSTGRIAKKDNFYGLELAAIRNNIWFASEYTFLKAKLENNSVQNPTFKGAYIEFGTFLTGETRAYKPSKGAWDRTKVKSSVFDGGYGAWSLTTRFDRIDLNDSAFNGGIQNTIILGVNWHLNPHTKLQINYNNSKVKKSDLSINGIDRKNTINGIGIRAQVDW